MTGPLVLALDTSTPVGSVALVHDGATRIEVSTRADSRHGETVIPVIERALADAGVTARDVGLVAVGIGPGSFTGLRVALATAKGLALALRVPLVGVSSLAALARGVHPADGALVVPLLDAHKAEVYGAVYEARGAAPLAERVAPFSLAPPAAIAKLRDALGAALDTATLVGDLLAPFASLAPLTSSRVPATPSAAALADEALRLLAVRGPDDLAALEPFYVRDADVT